MANPHHRKKHKHFQPPPHTRKQAKKGSVAPIMAIFGGIVGFAIVYLGVSGSIVWLITGTILAALLGYIVGKNLDKIAS